MWRKREEASERERQRNNDQKGRRLLNWAVISNFDTSSSTYEFELHLKLISHNSVENKLFHMCKWIGGIRLVAYFNAFFILEFVGERMKCDLYICVQLPEWGFVMVI